MFPVLLEDFYISYGSEDALVEMEVSNGSFTVGRLLPRGYTEAKIGASVGVGCDSEQGLVCWSDIRMKNIRCSVDSANCCCFALAVPVLVMWCC